MTKKKETSYELRRRLGDQGLRQSVPCQAGLDDKSATDNTLNASSRKSPRRRWSRRQKKKPTNSSPSSLNILQLNIDGMSIKSGKKEQLAKILHDNNIQVALVQETQHRSNNPHISGYTTYACECKDCQGIITYIRNNTTADVQDTTTTASATHVHKTTVWEDNKKFTLFNVYSPPGSVCNIPELQDTMYRNTIVAGDFNGHSPLWGYQDTNGSGKYIEELNETTNLIIQQDCNSTPTLLHKVSKTLSRPDLTLVSSDLDVLCTVLPDMGSDHRPILISIHRAQPQKQEKKLRWNFKKSNWKEYSTTSEEQFRNLNLENENLPDDLEKKIAATILDAAKKHIPRGHQRKYKPFWNKKVEEAVTARQQAREALEKDPNLTNKIEFKKTTAKAQQTILQAKREKWNSTVSNIDLRKNGREAWTLLNNLSGDKRKSNPRPMPEGETSKKKAELLNTHFYQTNKSRNDKTADEALLKELHDKEREKETSDPLFEDLFTEAELSFALRKLKGGKSPGPDHVHNEMLKHLGTYGRKALLKLINLTWEKSKIPKSWRNAHIVPIHKNGKDPKEAKSYRPISLTSCVGKLGERMVNRRLYWWLESTGILE